MSGNRRGSGTAGVGSGGTSAGRGLFQLGKYWIDWLNPKEPGGNLYRFWYDARARTNGRRSLGTGDLEQAKHKLAAIVVEGEHDDAKDPNRVLLVAVLSHYLKHRVPKIRSKAQAVRSCQLLTAHLIADKRLSANAKVSDFGAGEQKKFVKACRVAHNHSVGHLARIMGVLSSTYHFATKPALVTDVDGIEREIQLLRFAPHVVTGTKAIAEIIDAPEATPVGQIPSIEQLAAFLDTIVSESTFRYCIIALCTWARPEAVTDLRVNAQVDRAQGLINLLPPDKRQTKKRRPIQPLSATLAGWLDHWDADAPITWRGKPVKSSRKGFEKAYWRAALRSLRYTDRQIARVIGDPDRCRESVDKAQRQGFPKITRYTLRHFMVTRVAAVTLGDGNKVPRVQRQMWLGHEEGDTTSIYEHFEPDFLKDCAEGTDIIMRQLHAAAKRDVLPPAMRTASAGKGNLEVIDGGRS